MLLWGPSMETMTARGEGSLTANAYRRFLKSADFSKEELAAIYATDERSADDRHTWMIAGGGTRETSSFSRVSASTAF